MTPGGLEGWRPGSVQIMFTAGPGHGHGHPLNTFKNKATFFKKYISLVKRLHGFCVSVWCNVFRLLHLLVFSKNMLIICIDRGFVTNISMCD